MTGADDYQPLRTDNRIDEQAHAAVRFKMGHGPQRPRAVNFEQGGNRVGRPLDNLRVCRARQIDRARVVRVRIGGIDKASRPGRHFRSRTGIDHRQQGAGSAAAGGVGQLAGDSEVAGRRPQIDEHVHYSAAGADFPLVEIAGEIDLGQARTAIILFFK